MATTTMDEFARHAARYQFERDGLAEQIQALVARYDALGILIQEINLLTGAETLEVPPGVQKPVELPPEEPKPKQPRKLIRDGRNNHQAIQQIRDVVGAMGDVEFTLPDIMRKIEDCPSRTTVANVLTQLISESQVIIARRGRGRRPDLYRLQKA